MKKRSIVVISLIVLLAALTGCIGKEDSDNPLTGKDTDERIVMSLEAAYPEHDFKTIKKYDKYDGEYYAICADENGLEFRVDTIIYDNTYHFGCYDEYLKTVVESQDFYNKATEIASVNGYAFEKDFDSGDSELIINIDCNDVDTNKVANTILDILNCIDEVPEYVATPVEFSTGEVKYFTNPKMYKILYWFCSGDDEWLLPGSVEFNERNSSIDKVKKDIDEKLQKAYEMADNMND